MTRFVVLVNGGAGSVDAADEAGQVAAIEDAFAEAGAEARVQVVPPPELQATMRRIWDADGRPDAVVVAGGDGTVSSAAGEAAGSDLVVGVLPLGTFNHFAKDLGLPDDLVGAAAALVAAEPRPVDVGEVNGRVFVNNSVLGAYPEMVAVRDRIRATRGWGKVRAVPVAAFRVVRSLPVRRLELSGSDGFSRQHVRTPFLFVGNGTYDNGTGGLSARDSLEDGRLGIYVARVVSRWGLVRTVVRAIVSGTESARDLDRADLAELRVGVRARHLRVALDGEICWMETPLRYRVRPRALWVLAPTPAPLDPGSDPAATAVT